MDSLDWSKKYEVLSISRLMLRDQLGFSTEQVQQLSDKDMEQIADGMREIYAHLEEECGIDHGFEEKVAFLTTALLMGKEGDNQIGGQHETLDRGA